MRRWRRGLAAFSQGAIGIHCRNCCYVRGFPSGDTNPQGLWCAQVNSLLFRVSACAIWLASPMKSWLVTTELVIGPSRRYPLILLPELRYYCTLPKDEGSRRVFNNYAGRRKYRDEL